MPTTYPAPPTTDQYLDDGGAAHTTDSFGKYSGAARVYDSGAGPVLMNGFFVFNVTAITGAWTLQVELSNASDFSSGVVTRLPLSVIATGAVAPSISNQVAGTIYRYIRIHVIPPGSGSPTITVAAWLLKTVDIDALTGAQLVSMLGFTTNRYNDAIEQFRLWADGSETGGPGSDGLYPLSDGQGNTTLLPCPAKLEALATAGLSTSSIASQTEATTFDPTDLTTPDLEPVLIGLMGPSGSQVLKKFSAYLIGPRRTKDLNDYTDGDDSITNLWLSVINSSGLESKLAMKQLMRSTQGFIDPISQFGCKGDARFTRSKGTSTDGIAFSNTGITSTNGSAVIEANSEDLWTAADVGKIIQLSNAASGSQPLKSTIIAFGDARHVTIGVNCGNSTDLNDCLWTTDDSVPFQNALDAIAPTATYQYGGLLVLPSGRAFGTGSLIYHPRTGIVGFGERQGGLIRIDDGATYDAEFASDQPAPHLWNDDRGCDFPVMCGFYLNGAKFCQSTAYPQFLFWAWTGDKSLYYSQDNPYPQFTRLHCYQSGWTGFEMRNLNSGSAGIIEVIEAGLTGFQIACYDANIFNTLAIGCSAPALFIEGQGANNNILNMKLSFSGNGSESQFLFGSTTGSSLAVIEGNGNNITNMRSQESLGPNLTIAGSFNNIGHTTLEDTGDINPISGFGSVPIVCPAILLKQGASFNQFNDVNIDAVVHVGSNYLSHELFFADGDGSAPPLGNSGRILARGVNGDFSLSASGSQSSPYNARRVGTDDPGGIDSSNNSLIVDNETVDFWYP